MTPGPLLLFAAAGLTAGLVAGRRHAPAWLGFTLAGAVAALVAAAQLLLGGAPWEWRSEFAVAGQPLHLRLDALGALFLALVAVVGGAGSVYAHGYWSDRDYPQSAPRGRLWWNTLLLSLGAVLLSWNGLHFLIAWELFTVAAFFLITLENQRRDVRAAGWLYLAASHLGTMCLFAFFAALAARTGSWELGPMRERADLAPLFWLALVGFGLKAGMFPLHIWLPSAHANAPSHVSAIMSGVTIKLGIYGLLRTAGWLPVPAAAPWTLIVLGAVTALLGIAFALAQSDVKRLLAYCSVENIGIILIGLGGALLAAADGSTSLTAGAAWGRLALAGALLHVWNHGLFKSLLFFGAGSVLHATGTREMSRLGGLWRAMPWTASLFALGAVAISGLPPLNGFVSEWLVYLGLFDAVTSRSPAAWAALPAAIMLGVTGALALATFVKAGSLIFLGAPRTAAARDAHECSPWMRGPMVAVAAACGAIALAPALCWPLIARAAGAWQPGWADLTPPASLFTLGGMQVALALLAFAAGFALWRRARADDVTRQLTWDCGYVVPTARMQYTSDSFAGIAGGWFAWILQPQRRLRRPRGLFPEGASRMERVPETVLERLIGPVAAVVMQASLAVRRLQHGRLQYYIAYVVVGLAGLGTLVVLGGGS
ncbi:MAG: NADH-quinone oxidoreductase subunit H [Verrucomicrobia bacterium]|nr:NADH-quinone oxidoreductase subunit H [Verrucomicrobiota bacterium]